MNGISWLNPGVVLGSILYALIGVLVFWICFMVVDKLTPYHLWDQIVEKKNVALGIVVGSMCIAIGLIVSAAIHG
ncbi:MAG: DUF350 domain-containing protein [Paucibacter sp.]|nr:DUF350 domain-containing protein [Roseateles sp.]